MSHKTGQELEKYLWREVRKGGKLRIGISIESLLSKLRMSLKMKLTWRRKRVKN